MIEITASLMFICDACGGNGDFFGPLGDDRCPKCGGNAHVARALRAENERLRDALRHIESADVCHYNTYREWGIALRRLARSALASNPMETIKP